MAEGSCILNEFNTLFDNYQPPVLDDFYIFGDTGSGKAPNLGALGGMCSSIISLLLDAHVDAENILLLDSSLILEPRLEVLSSDVFCYIDRSFSLIFFYRLLQDGNWFTLCLS